MKKGFTLIELLIVVAIIGILAGVGIPMYNGYMETAKVNAVKKQHKQIASYLSAEFFKCNLGNSKVLINTLKKRQENCPITPYNNTIKASASDILTGQMKNIYLGSGTSAFESASQVGAVLPCSTSKNSEGCHGFSFQAEHNGNRKDKGFRITSYFTDDGDITDKDSKPDLIVTIISF